MATNIMLPTFDGKNERLQFLEFIEQFDALMNYMQVDVLGRLIYLKQSLTGDAKILISGLPSRAVNYSIARKLLDETYGGSLRIQQSLLQQLENITSIHNSTSARDLHMFYVSTIKIFRQLQAYNCNVDNMMTATIIASKLPKWIIKKLYSDITRSSPFIASELIDRLRVISREENLVDDIWTINHGHEMTREHQTTTMSVLSESYQIQTCEPLDNEHVINPVQQCCHFCTPSNITHISEDCRRYITRHERKVRAAELKLCFKCLKLGHSTKFCRSQCRTCNGAHHTALCFDTQIRMQSEEESFTPSDFIGTVSEFNRKYCQKWNQNNHQFSQPTRIQQQRPMQPHQQYQPHGSHTVGYRPAVGYTIGYRQNHSHHQSNRYQQSNGNKQNFANQQRGNGFRHRIQQNRQPAMVTNAVNPLPREMQKSLSTSEDTRTQIQAMTFQVSQTSTSKDSTLQTSKDKLKMEENKIELENPVLMKTRTVPVVDMKTVEKKATVTDGLTMADDRRKKLVSNSMDSTKPNKLDSRELKVELKIREKNRSVKHCEINQIADSVGKKTTTKHVIPEHFNKCGSLVSSRETISTKMDHRNMNGFHREYNDMETTSNYFVGLGRFSKWKTRKKKTLDLLTKIFHWIWTVILAATIWICSIGMPQYKYQWKQSQDGGLLHQLRRSCDNRWMGMLYGSIVCALCVGQRITTVFVYSIAAVSVGRALLRSEMVKKEQNTTGAGQNGPMEQEWFFVI